MGYIMLQLRRRSFGGILLLLATLCLLPGISFFAGLIIIFPGLQMVLGLRAPLLPRFLRKHEYGVALLKELGESAIPWIQRFERFVKPRWLLLTVPPMTNLIGLMIIALAFVVMLPLPFSNLPPSISLLCLAFGLLERDGLVVFIGLIAGLVALIIGVVISYIAYRGVNVFFAQPF